MQGNKLIKNKKQVTLFNNGQYLEEESPKFA